MEHVGLAQPRDDVVLVVLGAREPHHVVARRGLLAAAHGRVVVAVRAGRRAVRLAHVLEQALVGRGHEVALRDHDRGRLAVHVQHAPALAVPVEPVAAEVHVARRVVADLREGGQVDALFEDALWGGGVFSSVVSITNSTEMPSTPMW